MRLNDFNQKKLNIRIRSLLFLSVILIGANASAQSWVTVEDIPNGRHHPVTFSLNGKGYVLTGTTSNQNYTDDFYEYDPVSDTWTSLTDFPGDDRSFSIGVVNNGLGYMGFGSKGQGDYLDDLWKFDPVSGTWTELASCPCSGRTHPAMITLGDKIYVGLGNNDINNLKDWWEYDISDDAWIQMSDLPGPRRHHPYQFTAGGNVYAGLGHGVGIYDDWYKLDTATNSWTAMSDFPGEARVAGTQFDHDGYGYVLSGDGDNHSYMASGEMWKYDPANDSWTQLVPHPGVSLWAPGSFVIDDDVYFLGGYNRLWSSYPDAVQKFDLLAPSVGIEKELLVEITVYPNSSTSAISIEMEQSIQDCEVEIYNFNGQLVRRETFNGLKQEMDVSDLVAGTYVLLITEGGQMKAREVLVKE